MRTLGGEVAQGPSGSQRSMEVSQTRSRSVTLLYLGAVRRFGSSVTPGMR